MTTFNFRKSSSSSVDRGWAWIVLLACFLEYFIILGMFKSFGLFFVQYQKKYATSASILSMVLSVQTIVASVSSIIIMGIGTRYLTERTMVMCAAIIGLACQLGNAYAPFAEFLFFTHSALFAISAMFAHLPSMLMVGKYFEKHRGMANAIANVGGSFGGLALPFLLTFLFSEYGLEGTLTIAGGLYLHFLPIGLLMRPIDREQNTKKDNKKKEHDKISDINDHNEYLISNDKENNLRIEYDIRNTFTGSKHSLHSLVNLNGKSHSLTNIDSTHIRNSKIQSLELCGSSMNLASTVSLDMINTAKSKNQMDSASSKYNEKRNCCIQFLFVLFDFSLFKDAKFVILMVFSFLVAAGCTIPVTYIAPFAKDKGLETDMIGYLLTISAASDLIGRTLFIFISDNKKIQRCHMMTIAIMANGIVCLMASFYNDFVTLAVFGILQASFGGTYYSLINVLIVDFIGLENLSHGLVMGTVTRGTSIAITSTLVGFIRDKTGSYVGGFYLMGVCLILGGFLLLLKPFISK
ncbi:monocarboxylate transporter 5-like [Saccostrea echinata]|uniref:monocarboxylate transporter 5-like n=1 Tax=Saccostrea echinata TaxID=191078 RepID=UPI002A7F108D|nr:monocarboxylate transporter 5-like [Saccostrea echinata]